MKSKRIEVYEPLYFLCLNTAEYFLRRDQEKSSKWPVPIYLSFQAYNNGYIFQFFAKFS